MIIPKIITPLTMLAIAKILAPEVFGLLSTAMIVISFSQMFWEAGMTKALINIKENVDESANSVFYFNSAISIIIYTIIFFLSPLLAVYFNNTSVELIIKILSIQIVINAFYAVQEALFIKELNFKAIFWIKLISIVISSLISITLAIIFHNVWALVWGTLSGSIFNLLLFWYFSDWRPSMIINLRLSFKLLKFGIWVLFLGIMGWIINWYDSILVGRYFGMYELGIYRTSVLLISMIFSLVMTPISTLVFPAFSKINNDIQKITKYFHFANKTILFIILPISVLLFLYNEQIVLYFFGTKWKNLSYVLGVLSLSEGIGFMVSLNPTIYQAIGRPDLQPKVSFFLLPLFILVYYFITPLGIGYLVWSKFFLTLITTPFNIFLIVKATGIKYNYLFKQGKNIFLSLFIMILFSYLLKFIFLPNSLMSLILSSLICITIYFYLIFKMEKLFLFQLIDLVMNSLIKIREKI